MPEKDSRKPPEEPDKLLESTRVYSPEEAAEARRKARETMERMDAQVPHIGLPIRELPGAPNFTEYLRELAEERGKDRRKRVPLMAERQRGSSDEVYFTKMGDVFVGTYTVFPQEDGETDCAKEFVFANTSMLPGNYRGSIVLRWNNKKYVQGIEGDGKYMEVKTGWKRHDPYADKIPFP